jgi:ArsR family transcriptional regulator, arsenate/arsenite/antimonite-responsive transcriptional repressor
VISYKRKEKSLLENIELMSKQLKAVSDPNRLKLLACLKKGELCACDFVGVLQVSQPAVSQQLKKLKEAEIIIERPAGTWKHYRLNDELPSYIQAIIDQLEEIPLNRCNC